MSVWILVIFLHGHTPTVVEFDSQGACNIAKTWFLQSVEQRRYYQAPIVNCFKR